tara:strand:- start:15 stop:212 length:198 start_codon:yes stop_codon:yes gene_type:complete
MYQIDEPDPIILLEPYDDGILVTIPACGFSHKKKMPAKEMTQLAIFLLEKAVKQNDDIDEQIQSR